MRYAKLLLTLTLWADSALLVCGQEKESKWAWRGYLKNMSTLSWSPYLGDTLWFDNLVHNRLNLTWYPTDNLTAVLEVRNRLLTGASVKNIPNYNEFVDSNNDFFDLSWNALDNENVLLNLMIDRLYVQWAKDDWEVKLGRQRINWGINLAWNPNDLFNAYSYFDFDYEERPGSDALRLTYYTGVAGSMEVAAKLADSYDTWVAAAMYKFNKKSYDIQLLGGMAQGDLALGSGWAGNLGQAGFKGEATYFIPIVETPANTNYLRNPLTGDYVLDGNGQRIKESARYSTLLLAAVSIDYSFQNSLYLNGSIMYNSAGSYDGNILAAAIGQRYSEFTVRDLSPYPWSAFVQANYQFTPLLYGGLALMPFPGTNSFFANPYLTYSLVQNLDLDLVGQFFWGDNQRGSYDALSKALYIRLKWSF